LSITTPKSSVTIWRRLLSGCTIFERFGYE